MGVWEPSNNWWRHVADVPVSRDDLAAGYRLLYRSPHHRMALRRTLLIVAAMIFAFSIFLTLGWAVWLNQGRVGERAWPWLYWMWFGSPVMLIAVVVGIGTGVLYTYVAKRRKIGATLRFIEARLVDHELTLCWNDSHMLAQVDEREFSFELVNSVTWDETDEMLVIKPPIGILSLCREALSEAQAAHLRERMVMLAVPRGRLPQYVVWASASI